MADGKGVVDTWKKRIRASKSLYEQWEKTCRVQESYNFWKGEQRAEPFDEFGHRRAQINKIHPEVRNNIPSLYYYRPFARLNATPEELDDPGTTVEQDTQLLQDTLNHLIRDKRTMYREATHLALKEAHWAVGVVEVGYSAKFVEAPNTERPALKEKKSTKKEPEPKPEPAAADPLAGMLTGGVQEELPDLTAGVPQEAMPGGFGDPELEALEGEIAQLESELKSEQFFVKHIPSNHVLISISDMPILALNDWVGYWEDVPLEDVKRSKAYENTSDLKPNCGEEDERAKQTVEAAREAEGESDKVRLYKIWDLRTMQKIVLAEGHDKVLMRKPFKRCPLKFLRFDVDPYHFLPRPPLLSKLDPQIEYNDSREYLRQIRIGTVPRYTYDEDAVDADQMKKLESGMIGSYVPRKPGTVKPVEPIDQPSYSENAVQSLTLSDKEFADVGGVGGDGQIAQSKTATQAKISETKSQVQDSFDRQIVSEFLADVAKELLQLAVERMSLETVIAINTVPDSMYAPQIGAQVAQTFKRINSNMLSEAASGVEWDVIIDLEALSPVSEEEKFQKWMQGLSLLGNPVLARLFSVSPEVMKYTLNLLGLKSDRQIVLIQQAMQQVVAMEAQLAAQGQNAAPGMPSQPSSGAPSAPKGGPPAGGPQPNAGKPTGPGASAPR